MSASILISGLILVGVTKIHKIFESSPLVSRMIYITMFIGVFLLVSFVEEIYKNKGWYGP